jgi:hypothetical protein
MSSDWKKEEAELVLKSLIFRINNTPDKVTIKREGSSVKFSDSKYSHSHIHIEDDTTRVWIKLDTHSGFYTPSVFPWNDKEAKFMIEQLRKMALDPISAKAQAIRECFPESTHVAFEKTVLEGK